MTERLLDVDEARDWLGVSRWTMYALARSGQVRNVRVGRLLRFRETWLTAYAEGNATGPEVESARVHTRQYETVRDSTASR